MIRDWGRWLSEDSIGFEGGLRRRGYRDAGRRKFEFFGWDCGYSSWSRAKCLKSNSTVLDQFCWRIPQKHSWPREITGKDRSELSLAIESLDSDRIQLALERGGDPNEICEVYSCTMLQLAIMIQADCWEQADLPGAPSTEIVEMLLNAGADPNGLDLDGQNALDCAVDSVYAQSGSEYHRTAAAKLWSLGVEHTPAFFEILSRQIRDP